ncbi:iron-containing alcohol dehydrogenase [Maricurvus nonylphenolicus]|uniref:iron-containing alcohol dehydrogenase n=1 Tax=Maricurvus nonylphenolicus TaxID=1008307 RepID=UPI0036F44200
MPFSLQVLFYKTLMFFIGVAAKVIPQPKPTVYCGPDSALRLTNSMIQFGYKKVLIVTDRVLHEMGLLDPIKDKLASAGVEVTVYDGVEPNPTFSQVHEGLKLAKDNQCDSILTVGGGSPIDTAKIISLSAVPGAKAPEKFVGLFKARKAGLPLFAVPTTAGTGSEVSVGAVISDPVTHEKGVIADPKTVPTAAALDPNLMLGLPAPITAATGMDALTHAVEAYISKLATEATDSYAMASVKLIFGNLRECYSNGGNVDARESMAVASFYAAVAFNKAFLGYVHGIAHQFGGHYNTPHGLANAIVLPHILDYSKDACADRLAELAVAVDLGSSTESNSVLAQKFVDAVRELNNDLGIPKTLDALKSTDIPEIAKGALKESHFTYPVPKYMDQAQCEALIGKMVS